MIFLTLLIRWVEVRFSGRVTGNSEVSEDCSFRHYATGMMKVPWKLNLAELREAGEEYVPHSSQPQT